MPSHHRHWQLLTALPLACALAAPAGADKRLDEARSKAEAQLAKGKEDEAVKTLRKAAASAPRDAEAQLALAQLLLRLGRLTDAAPAFDEAGLRAKTAAAALRARVLAERSSFALRAGTSQDAIALARQAVEAGADATSLAALARAQARRGDAAARGSAERAIALAPDAPFAQVAQGDALLAARLAAQAEAAYRRALELSPRLMPAELGLARALAAQGRSAAAAEAARAAMEIDARAGEPPATLALALLALDPLDQKSEAIAAAQQANVLEPGDPWVQLVLGRVFASRGQPEKAAVPYREAARLDPSWATPRVAALELKLAAGDVDGALGGLRALPADLVASGEAQLLLGRLLLRKNDPRGAKAALDRAAAALPGAAELQAAHGDAAYETGELTLAADAYGRAVEADPANLQYRARHAVLLSYDGRLDQAVAIMLDLVARPAGRTADNMIALGDIYRSLEPPRVDEAVAAYQEAAKLAPKSGPAALGVARSHRAGKQWAQAAEAYERASTVDKRLTREALLGAAWCYYRSGDSYKAGFYTGLAARAGADVSALRNVLTRAPWPADELDDLVRQLRSKHAGEQARAVRGLVALGRIGVAPLAAALQKPTTAIAVREAIVQGLASMAGTARDALPTLERLVQAGPARAASAENAEREKRLVAAMRESAAAIRGK